MEYITVGEAAKKWDVSPRQVQRLLSKNRIPGARKYGRSWMIPADTKKPSDPRLAPDSPGASPEQNSSDEADLLDLLSKTYIFVPIYDPESIFAQIDDERARIFHRACFAYLKGDFEETILCYRECENDFNAKLVVSTVAFPAAISIGDYILFEEIEKFLKQVVHTTTSKMIVSFAELILSNGYLGALAATMAPKWMKDGDFTSLPPYVKFDAARARAKYFQCRGDYTSMLNVAQTALSLFDSSRETSFPAIYMNVFSAFAFFERGDEKNAEKYLLNAMEKSLKNAYITPFAEALYQFGGLVEKLLAQYYPEWLNPVVEQSRRIFPNWVSFHNRFTRDNVTQILSRREYHIALASSKNVPYAIIAEQHGISVSRLKSIMREIFDKLNIKNRKELAQYLL